MKNEKIKVSGATIIRNGVKYGYPFVESVRSVLPLCDEFVVGVGDSDDGTRAKIEAIRDEKIKIFDSVWDMKMREGGKILSVETNKVLKKCSGDFIFYVQSDEVISGRDYGRIGEAISFASERENIDGIAFDYLHFYGSYYTVQDSRSWYRSEVRIIKNGRGIVSHGDAQGFRRDGGRISAINCGANVYHYGWARPPQVMAEKIRDFHKFWHDDGWVEKNTAGKQMKDHFSDLGNLADFGGTHPETMNVVANREFEPFIRALREQWHKESGFGKKIKAWVNSLRLGDHKNFKEIKWRRT
ncbi:MAG: hypothetical protein JW803_04595 [Endomicrobiales bacterium]|nr:hypothetical protein [Endomicrobiales bacterium]